MTLIVPTEARETPSVWRLDRAASSPATAPIRRVEVVDVRQSMANGGGPACLRLRVVADPATVDPRFLVDEAKLDRLAEVIRRHWPGEIAIARPPEAGADPRRRSARAPRCSRRWTSASSPEFPKRDKMPILTAKLTLFIRAERLKTALESFGR